MFLNTNAFQYLSSILSTSLTLRCVSEHYVIPKSSSELVSPEWMKKLCVSTTAFAKTQSNVCRNCEVCFFQKKEVPWNRSVYWALSRDSSDTHRTICWVTARGNKKHVKGRQSSAL